MEISMGYSTGYKLKVEALDKEKKTDKVTIDSLIEQISNASSVDKEQLLAKLEALKNGGKVVVTAAHIIEKFRDKYEYASYALRKDGSTNEPCKWYEHDDELKEFSKNYPNWLFTLEGKGEEAGDLWKKYFVNGKMQEAQAKIIFDEFDPAKLEE
jgi:hypothetical protein